MFYAVTASGGLQGVYQSRKEVENIKRIRPFTEVRRFYLKEDAEKYLKGRSTNKHEFESVQGFGFVSPMYVSVTYEIIGDGSAIIRVDTDKVGDISIEGFTIVGVRRLAYRFPISNFREESIDSHMIIISKIFKLLSGLIDIELRVPYYSVFYALNGYKGKRRLVLEAQEAYRKCESKIITIERGDM